MKNPENSDFDRKSLTSIPFGGPICTSDMQLFPCAGASDAHMGPLGVILSRSEGFPKRDIWFLGTMD